MTVGHAIAAGWRSRQPRQQHLLGLVRELGEHARAATPVEAAEAGDLVVASIPLQAYRELPARARVGKTDIDTMNYYPEHTGRIAELDAGTLTSSALVKRHLAESHVVKAFNSIDFLRLFSLARPPDSSDRSALPIAGDDPTAKGQAAQPLDTLGYDAVDVGTLAQSWRSEPGTPVYVQPYLPALPNGLSAEEQQTWFFNAEGVPVPAYRLNQLARTAVRLIPGNAPGASRGSRRLRFPHRF